MGTAAREALWRKLCQQHVIGPVFYDLCDDPSEGGTYSVDDLKYRLSIGALCRILELLDQVCSPRLRQLRHRIICARREAFKANDWDKHAYFLQLLGMQELHVRDEALSYVLGRLEISFEVFQASFDYYVANKDSSTQHEFALIAKMQAKCRQEEEK